MEELSEQVAQLRTLTGANNPNQRTLPQIEGELNGLAGQVTSLGTWRTITNTTIQDLSRNKFATQDYDRYKQRVDGELERLGNLKTMDYSSDLNSINDLLQGLVAWKDKGYVDYAKKVDSRLGELESWKTGTRNPYMTQTDTRIKDLEANRPTIDDFATNQRKVDERLNSLSRFAETSLPLLDQVPSMSGRLSALEGKTTGLESKVSEHDDKLKKVDKQLVNVSKEIRKNHGKVGNELRIIKELIQREILGPNPACPIIDNRSLAPYLSNNQSPNGINVANYGQLSFHHAPDCTRRFNPPYESLSSPGIIYCPCQPLLAPSYGAPRLLSAIMPASSFELSFLESRSSRYSGSREGSSNFNFTPNITLGLERTSGGGPFSKQKTEGLSFEIGRGGGRGKNSRRKHRSRDDQLFTM
jgi:cell fate (sporulation/competence/biofilm development) regulator YmcA (YheA/YmcA/DUF963 family)